MAGDGTWTIVSALPECDIHKYVKGEPGVEARYDGATRFRSSWANMCEPCFGEYGVGLGLGRGQRLILQGEPTPEAPAASHSREKSERWCLTCGQYEDDGPHRDTAHEPNWVGE